ncbi:hypothetical protein Hanom_Chr04g00321731 [Helianthus anomalus]
MIRCLDRTVEAWLPNGCFLGPMPLLVVSSEYLHDFLNTHLEQAEQVHLRLIHISWFLH